MKCEIVLTMLVLHEEVFDPAQHHKFLQCLLNGFLIIYFVKLLNDTVYIW